MRLCLAVICSSVTGCTAIGTATGLPVEKLLPSLQYCHSIKYEREGSKLHIEADCLVPAGVAAQ